MYNDPFVRLLLSPERRLIRHFSIIVLLAIIIYSGDASEYPPKMFLLLMSGALVMVLILPYLNMYLLVPRYLFKGKYVQYFLSTLVAVVLFVILFNQVGRALKGFQVNPQETKDETVSSVISFSVALGILIAASTAIKLFQRWVKDNYRMANMENEKLHAELEQLKSQVNPHFLFNMLNNANVLTRTDPDKASEVLYSLSDLLRYQLYGSREPLVSLHGEINFLQNLLELECIRRDHFSFSITKPEQVAQVMVPPLLFITFAENAVKHSAAAKNASYVHLHFEVQHTTLRFTCSNSRPQTPGRNGGEPGGLGLVNIGRRLELLFPERHQLQVNKQVHQYSVTLTLQL
jgi:LytS/YehU family sensor histidine kinase